MGCKVLVVEDEIFVAVEIENVVAELGHRPVGIAADSKSALAMAAEAEVALVDLNLRDGRTIVAVLHDLNQACRYADHLVAMREGAIVAEGPPAEVVTAELVEEVFGLACAVVPDPVAGSPMVVAR